MRQLGAATLWLAAAAATLTLVLSSSLRVDNVATYSRLKSPEVRGNPHYGEVKKDLIAPRSQSCNQVSGEREIVAPSGSARLVDDAIRGPAGGSKIRNTFQISTKKHAQQSKRNFTKQDRRFRRHTNQILTPFSRHFGANHSNSQSSGGGANEDETKRLNELLMNSTKFNINVNSNFPFLNDLLASDIQPQDYSPTNNLSSGQEIQVLELNLFEATSLGYFRYPPVVSVIITIGYTCVFIIGLVGNSFVVCIVYKSPRMRTVTNYFIANLALADILVLLFCLPATLIGNLFIPYVLGLYVCKTVSYLQGVAVSASINTMVAVTIDRFLAICFPMDWHMSRRVVRRVIASIWLFSLAIALPWAIYFDLVAYPMSNDSQPIAVCAEDWPSEMWGRVYFVGANLIINYLFPALVITICYLGIWYKIERRDIPGDRPKGLKIEVIMQKSKLKVIKMMMVVVLFFLVSWLPTYLLFARLKLFPEARREPWEDWIINNVMPLAQWLGASNSCINPILYTFFNRKYKRGFRDLLYFVFCCRPFSQEPLNSSSSATNIVGSSAHLQAKHVTKKSTNGGSGSNEHNHNQSHNNWKSAGCTSLANRISSSSFANQAAKSRVYSKNHSLARQRGECSHNHHHHKLQHGQRAANYLFAEESLASSEHGAVTSKLNSNGTGLVANGASGCHHACYNGRDSCSIGRGNNEESSVTNNHCSIDMPPASGQARNSHHDETDSSCSSESKQMGYSVAKRGLSGDNRAASLPTNEPTAQPTLPTSLPAPTTSSNQAISSAALTLTGDYNTSATTCSSDATKKLHQSEACTCSRSALASPGKRRHCDHCTHQNNNHHHHHHHHNHRTCNDQTKHPRNHRRRCCLHNSHHHNHHHHSHRRESAEICDTSAAAPGAATDGHNSTRPNSRLSTCSNAGTVVDAQRGVSPTGSDRERARRPGRGCSSGSRCCRCLIDQSQALRPKGQAKQKIRFGRGSREEKRDPNSNNDREQNVEHDDEGTDNNYPDSNDDEDREEEEDAPTCMRFNRSSGDLDAANTTTSACLQLKSHCGMRDIDMRLNDKMRCKSSADIQPQGSSSGLGAKRRLRFLSFTSGSDKNQIGVGSQKLNKDEQADCGKEKLKVVTVGGVSRLKRRRRNFLLGARKSCSGDRSGADSVRDTTESTDVTVISLSNGIGSCTKIRNNQTTDGIDRDLNTMTGSREGKRRTSVATTMQATHSNMSSMSLKNLDFSPDGDDGGAGCNLDAEPNLMSKLGTSRIGIGSSVNTSASKSESMLKGGNKSVDNGDSDGGDGMQQQQHTHQRRQSASYNNLMTTSRGTDDTALSRLLSNGRLKTNRYLEGGKLGVRRDNTISSSAEGDKDDNGKDEDGENHGEQDNEIDWREDGYEEDDMTDEDEYYDEEDCIDREHDDAHRDDENKNGNKEERGSGVELRSWIRRERDRERDQNLGQQEHRCRDLGNDDIGDGEEQGNSDNQERNSDSDSVEEDEGLLFGSRAASSKSSTGDELLPEGLATTGSRLVKVVIHKLSSVKGLASGGSASQTQSRPSSRASSAIFGQPERSTATTNRKLALQNQIFFPRRNNNLNNATTTLEAETDFTTSRSKPVTSVCSDHQNSNTVMAAAATSVTKLGNSNSDSCKKVLPPR